MLMGCSNGLSHVRWHGSRMDHVQRDFLEWGCKVKEWAKNRDNKGTLEKHIQTDVGSSCEVQGIYSANTTQASQQRTLSQYHLSFFSFLYLTHLGITYRHP